MNIEEYKELVAQEAKQEENPDKQEATPAPETPVVDEKTTEPEQPTTWEVNGQEVTIDELTKGYLRQSDYTKKTTEIAKTKKEATEALALYDAVQKNPELLEQMKAAGVDAKLLDKATAEHRRLADVESELASLKLDNMLNELKSKYSDFDEVSVLNEAAKRGTTDLEFVYKATRKDKGGDEKVDEAKLKEKLLAEIKSELGIGQEVVPPTMMDGKKTNSTPDANPDGPTMTPEEVRMAAAFGMTHEEYIRNRDM